jgi:hypothetical protein
MERAAGKFWQAIRRLHVAGSASSIHAGFAVYLMGPYVAIPNIIARLTPILDRTRVKRLQEDWEALAKSRYRLFVRWLQVDDRIGMPHWPTARTLPSLSAIISKPLANASQTEEQFWASALRPAVAEAAEHKIRVKRDTIHMMKRDLVSQPLTVDPDEALRRASTVFFCGNTDCTTVQRRARGEVCPELFSYAGVIDHIREEWFTRAWGEGGYMPLPRCSWDIIHMARVALEKLGFPADVPRDVIDALGNRFVCLCGHPQFVEPVSFHDLVSAPASFGIYDDSDSLV